MTTTTTRPAAESGTFTLAASSSSPITVNRLGYGAMRITGKGIWGEPADRAECIAVLRRAVELGVDFIDTADSYGPEVSEDIIREALHPYDGITIATKAGLTRQGPDIWTPVGRPEYLRQCAEMSLRRLGVEQIDLFQLHRIDPKVPADEQLGLLRDLQTEGKIVHIGLSEVSVEEIEHARSIVDVVSVQNIYNVGNREHDDVLAYCEREGIAFIPWFPIAGGELVKDGSPLVDTAKAVGATTAQVSIAWLLQHSPATLPIPGTSSVSHLEENIGSAGVTLSADQMATLDALAS